MPRMIRKQLSRLRWRERLVRLTWSATLWLSLAALALTIFCAVDFFIDRHQDTPLVLRYGMFVAQSALWIGAAVFLGAWALFRSMGDEDLALHVEERLPEFGDRLISALQLNRPGADTKGMSPALIEAVTRQAEEKAAGVNFGALADHSHWQRAMRLAVPLLLGVLLVLALWSDTLAALVRRQFLANVEIPRSVAVANQTREVWPSGEEVVLRFHARGRGLNDDITGTVRVTPKRLTDVNTATAAQLARATGLDHATAHQIVAQRDKEPYKTLDDLQRAGLDQSTIDRVRHHLSVGHQPAEDYSLIRESQSADGAVYMAKIPPGSVDFSFNAWLGDGRTRQPATVRYEPRPAITRQDAWVILPEYCGLRPSGQRYEMYQPKADISGLPGSSARVVIETQKPVRQATLELIGVQREADVTGLPLLTTDPLSALVGQPHLWKDAPEAARAKGKEIVSRRVPMTLRHDGQQAVANFELQPGETTYRVVVEDEYEFVNLDPPRRRVEIVPEGPPLVELLAERFPGSDSIGFTEEDDVAGIPILLGSKVRVAYSARHPYGLGKATLVYRINEGDWWRLPLAEVKDDGGRGPFDIRRGLFQKSGQNDRVEYHAATSPDPEAMIGRALGGGQFDFETAKLPGVNSGDRLEYYVEVTGRNPALADDPGKSDVRLKTILPEEEFLAWMRTTLQQETRLRQLEKRQRGVFTTVSVDDPAANRPIGAAAVSNSIRDWQIIGPFPDTGDGHARAWPAQNEPINLGKEYDAAGKMVRWQAYRSSTDKVDFERALGTSEPSVAYAVCWVHLNKPHALSLSAVYAKSIKVYVNKAKVMDVISPKGEARQTVPTLTLREGWNEILVKLTGQAGQWYFDLDLSNLQKKRPDDLFYRITPPEDDDKKFVRQWQLLGPLPNPEKGRDTAFPPEQEEIKLDAEIEGIGGKVRWRPFRSNGNKVDLARFFDRPFEERNLAYAVCWVKVKQTRPAVLATGSDDGIKVWINRELKLDKPGEREAIPGSDTEKIELREGWNEVLVKVDNDFGRWGFFLELRDAETGRPVDAEFRMDPPK